MSVASHAHKQNILAKRDAVLVMPRKDGPTGRVGPVALRLSWPVRTGITAGAASLLHLALGAWQREISVAFATPSFACVTVMVCTAQHLGGTLHHSLHAVAGIILGSALATFTLFFAGTSAGAIVGIIFLQATLLLVPGEMERTIRFVVALTAIIAISRKCAFPT